jgi:hypothetical protein
MVMDRGDRIFLRWVRLAVSSSNTEALGRAAGEFGSYCYKDIESAALVGPISDAVWKELVGYLGDRRFQGLDGSFKLVLLFQSEWARLTLTQRHLLLAAIKNKYSEIHDRASCLLLAQLLGEYFCDWDGFEVLVQLQTTPDPVRRAHVAEGYGALAKLANDAKLRQAATARLQAMSNDRAPQVAETARLMLRRLHKR